MKNLLIVGADHLGNIEDKLKDYGFDEIIHVSGRKGNMVKKGIPECVDVIFIMIDFVNHNLAKVIKQKAKDQNIKTYFVKRSWCSIYQTLEQHGGGRIAV